MISYAKTAAQWPCSYRIVSRLLTHLVLLALALPARAQLEPFQLRFSVGSKHLDLATTEISLSRVGYDEQIRSVSKARGIFALFNQDELVESSRVQYRHGRYYPLSYQWLNKQKNKTTIVRYDYDYKHSQVVHKKQDKSFKLPLKENSYDPASIILALADWVKNNLQQMRQEKLQKSFDYHDHNRSWEKVFQSQGEQHLQLIWGEVDAIKIQQIDHNEAMQTTTWVAPQLGFIPVLIEQYKNGELYARMELEAIL